MLHFRCDVTQQMLKLQVVQSGVDPGPAGNNEDIRAINSID